MYVVELPEVCSDDRKQEDSSVYVVEFSEVCSEDIQEDSSV